MQAMNWLNGENSWGIKSERPGQARPPVTLDPGCDRSWGELAGVQPEKGTVFAGFPVPS